MNDLVHSLWSGEEGQDIAEYAVMLAVILVSRWHPEIDRLKCECRLLQRGQYDAVGAGAQ